MAIIFDEVTAEVAGEQATQGAQATAAETPVQPGDPAELVRREVQLMREREQRLVAD